VRTRGPTEVSENMKERGTPASVCVSPQIAVSECRSIRNKIRSPILETKVNYREGGIS
jgi:hypothetical protein